MSRPQVIVIPALAGIKNNPAIQIPLGFGSVVTLVNQSNYLGLTLCTDNNFSATTTWPLPASVVAPQTGVDNLWVQNPHNVDIQLVVYSGLVPVSLASIPSEMIYGGTYTIGSSGGIVIGISPPPNATGIYIITPSGYATAVGNQSGITYNPITESYLSSGGYNNIYNYYVLVAGLDTSISFTVSGTIGSTVVYGYLFGNLVIPQDVTIDNQPEVSINQGNNFATVDTASTTLTTIIASSSGSATNVIRSVSVWSPTAVAGSIFQVRTSATGTPHIATLSHPYQLTIPVMSIKVPVTYTISVVSSSSASCHWTIWYDIV